MRPSWLKAFFITPIVTWVVSYLGYKTLGFTPMGYVLSGVASGMVSSMLYYQLLPRAKVLITVLTYFALFVGDLKFPPTAAAGDLRSVSLLHSMVFDGAACVGLVIAMLTLGRIRHESGTGA